MLVFQIKRVVEEFKHFMSNPKEKKKVPSILQAQQLAQDTYDKRAYPKDTHALLCLVRQEIDLIIVPGNQCLKCLPYTVLKVFALSKRSLESWKGLVSAIKTKCQCI
jgi:hypothetical protein